MKTAIYAGSFDPLTNGHLDIIKRASKIFDKIIIAVSYNCNKKSFIPPQDRILLIKESVKGIKNAEDDTFDGLTVDYAKKCGADILLRGLRSSVDFDYEKEMAQTNFTINNTTETVFLISAPEYSFISSSGVREILKNGGDISKFVPEAVNLYFKHGI